MANAFNADHFPDVGKMVKANSPTNSEGFNSMKNSNGSTFPIFSMSDVFGTTTFHQHHEGRYGSGETPRLGDIVRALEGKDRITTGDVLTVDRLIRGADDTCRCVGLKEHEGLDYFPARFSLVRRKEFAQIETDAEGNASPNTEAKRATSNPPQDPPRPPKQLPQSDASGVERWDVRSVITLGDEPPYVIEKCRSGQFVKAADHDRVVADLQRKLQIREAEIGIGGSPPPYPTWMQQVESRDATIAELNKDAKEDHAVILAYQRRAEAAEAEVARLHKIVGDCELVAFDNCNPPQLWSWIGDWEGGAAEPLQRIKNAKDAVKEIADLTAQLAAANERVAEFEARLDAVRKMISAGQ